MRLQNTGIDAAHGEDESRHHDDPHEVRSLHLLRRRKIGGQQDSGQRTGIDKDGDGQRTHDQYGECHRGVGQASGTRRVAARQLRGIDGDERSRYCPARQHGREEFRQLIERRGEFAPFRVGRRIGVGRIAHTKSARQEQ